APGEVYATLLDEGTYLCSERTMYRLLAEHAEVRERRDQLRHPVYAAPELLARRPNELWSWDITKLFGPAKWTYFYLYVMLDFFPWYNTEHHHSALGLLTPADVHHDVAEQRVAARALVLATAYAAHPERFPAGRPHPPARPVEVWINPPKTRATEEALLH